MEQIRKAIARMEMAGLRIVTVLAGAVATAAAPLGSHRVVKTRRTWFRATALISSVLSAVLTFAPSAHASDPNDDFAFIRVGTAVIQIEFLHYAVRGSALTQAGGAMQSASVYVLQCDGFGHNCGRISANSGSPAFEVYTSYKDISAGHAYRTCGSVVDSTGARWINYCTPYLSYSTS
jgi:uncharacterized membrane protein